MYKCSSLMTTNRKMANLLNNLGNVFSARFHFGFICIVLWFNSSISSSHRWFFSLFRLCVLLCYQITSTDFRRKVNELRIFGRLLVNYGKLLETEFHAEMLGTKHSNLNYIFPIIFIYVFPSLVSSVYFDCPAST